MAEISIPLKLTLTQTLTTVFNRQLGAEVKIPSRATIQNDAEFVYALVSSVDTNKEHKDHGSTIKKLRRQLLPVTQACELKDPPFDGDIDAINVSEETLKFIENLLEKPPEGFKYVERFNDSKEELTEFIREWKAEQKAKSEAGAEPEKSKAKK